MKLTPTKAWSLGLLIILLFLTIGELSAAFNEYVFHRLGINRSIFLFILWMFPLLAAFITSYFSSKYKVILGLSYILIVPILGALAHYINGELGGTVDFTGVSGAIMTFKIYFVINSILVVIGTGLGVLSSKENENSLNPKNI